MRQKYPETCISSGCEGKSYCRGYCYRHYEEHRAAGSIPIRKFGASKAERVWRFVDRRGPDECWPWTGGSVVGGYGIVVLAGGKRQRANRAMWEITHGPIPAGEGYHGTVVMHLCDNRICVNPAHLRLGSQTDNHRDMCSKGRHVIEKSYGKGEAHPMAKPSLSDEAIREIRAAPKSACRRMAAKFDLKMSHVYNIRARRTWKHVT